METNNFTQAELETELANERDRRERAEGALEDAGDDLRRAQDDADTAEGRTRAVEQILTEVRGDLRRAIDALDTV